MSKNSGRSSWKKPSVPTRRSAARLSALWVFRQASPVMRPLLELFADVDTVMTVNHELFKSEEDLEDLSKIQLKAIIREQQKSIGIIYRAWKACRTALDPDFNPKAFSLSRKHRASAQLTSSTDQKSISATNRTRNGKPAKRTARRSVLAARSSGRASSGRSRTKKSTAYGEG